MHEKRTLREMNRLFPDVRTTLTSKQLLQNLAIKVENNKTTNKMDANTLRAIEESDEQVDSEIRRLS